MTWTSDCGTVRLFCGDCLDVLPTLEAGSVDAVVTDPPYGLSFMGKHWDHGIPGEQFWREAFRVAKPGCHLLAFGGTRTYHRLAVAIEDAGWEVRDCLGWIYGSGFPKSLDVSKAIDKGHGENRQRQLQFTAWMRSTGITAEQVSVATNSSMASHYLTDKSQPAIATADMFDKLRPYLPEVPEYIERLVCERTGLEWTAYKQRKVVGQGSSAISTRKELRNNKGTVWGADSSTFDITAPATDAARQWSGWGTALKPAWEPIILARKPLVGTVAANVLEHGTGGLNVDGCRVATMDVIPPMSGKAILGGSSDGWDRPWKNNEEGLRRRQQAADIAIEKANTLGRWPANIVHDGSGEVLDVLGEQSRFFYSAKASKADRDEGCQELPEVRRTDGRTTEHHVPNLRTTARANHHPTVKPTDLMRWLVRLVTPPGGAVLDPFMGSGSTGKAARLEGFRFVGIEREAEYHEIAKRRIEAELKRFPLFERAERQKQGELFQ